NLTLGFYRFVIQTQPRLSAESDINNNVAVSAFAQLTYPPTADLAPSNIMTPTTGQPGQTATVSWRVTNIGQLDAPGSWIDRVYLSLDGSLNGAVQIGSKPHSGGLGKTGSYDASIDVTWPDLSDGGYRVVIVTDADNQVFQADKRDNDRGVSSDRLQL